MARPILPGSWLARLLYFSVCQKASWRVSDLVSATIAFAGNAYMVGACSKSHLRAQSCRTYTQSVPHYLHVRVVECIGCFFWIINSRLSSLHWSARQQMHAVDHRRNNSISNCRSLGRCKDNIYGRCSLYLCHACKVPLVWFERVRSHEFYCRGRRRKHPTRFLLVTARAQPVCLDCGRDGRFKVTSYLGN